MLYFYVFLILASETTAISLLKKFALTSDLRFLVLGFLFYTLVALFLVKTFHYEGMGVVNVLWSAFSVVFVVLAGVLFYHEHVTPVQLGAMGMIVTGVVVLRFFGA